MYTGQTIWAKNKKTYDAASLLYAHFSCSKDNHTNPSAHCCSAKNNGTRASTFCGSVVERLIATTPVTAKTALAPKLTDGEKHILHDIQFIPDSITGMVVHATVNL